MPNRILRDAILESDAVNKLTEKGEIFYRRLMSLVDDYGRYEARPEILRGKLFLLQMDRWSLQDVTAALRECMVTCRDDGTPLIRMYGVNGRNYLEITNFGQRCRTESKCPGPPKTINGNVNGENVSGFCQSNDRQPLTTDSSPQTSDGLVGGGGVFVCEGVRASSLRSEAEDPHATAAAAAAACSRAREKTPPETNNGSGGSGDGGFAPRKPETPNRPVAVPPMAKPQQRRESETPPPASDTAKRLVRDLMPGHSRLKECGHESRALEEAGKRFASAADPPALAQEYRERHARWCAYWRSHPEAFRPRLWGFFRDEFCELDPPDEMRPVARKDPMSELYRWAMEEDAKDAARKAAVC